MTWLVSLSHARQCRCSHSDYTSTLPRRIDVHRSIAARLPSSVTMLMLSFVYAYVSFKLE